MPFCIISEIIHPRKLNKKGGKHLFYYMPATPKKIWEDKG